MQVVDFFSGAGGARAGLRQAGLGIAVGIDRDPDAAATFRANFPEARFLEGDIREVRAADLDAPLARRRGQALLFVVCAPCQPFSKQNREKKRADDRAELLDELPRFLRRFEPDCVFLENVPESESAGGPVARFRELLAADGYRVAAAVVNALDYGVPRWRCRYVLAASRAGELRLPNPTHGRRAGNAPFSTVWEWIGDLPSLAAGGASAAVPNHRAAALSPLNLQRIASTPEGGDRRDWPAELVPACHRGHAGHTDVYGRLRRDRPASTLTTRCISLSNGRFGHPTQNRALSVREAACLQTFPRDFVFAGSLASMASQVGNAVPVLLARRFGEAIARHLAGAAPPPPPLELEKKPERAGPGPRAA